MQLDTKNKTIKLFLNTFISNDSIFKDIIKVCVYPSAIDDNQKFNIYTKDFLIDLDKKVQQLNLPNLQNIRSTIYMTKSILTIREHGSFILSLDTIPNHIQNLNISQQNLLKSIKNNLIDNNYDFNKTIQKIVSSIQIYYELNTISHDLTEFDNFYEYVNLNNISVYETTKLYKENVIRLYNSLNKLTAINKTDSEKDYFVISDRESVRELAKSLTQFITTDYSVFKTDLEIFDKYLDGFESSSLYLIAAPSNGGKSVFISNIVYQIINNNIDDFKPNDAILYITNEDDYKKLTRRLMSIFGNYQAETIKNSYLQGYQASKTSNVETVQSKLEIIMDNAIAASIYKKTQNKVHLIVKHANERTYSAADVSKFIDTLKAESNFNMKMVIIDYLDNMAPSMSSNFNSGDIYVTQGIITQELRLLTKAHNIPIVTATQNKREAENFNYKQTNASIGDSFNKIRYSDYVLMCRLDRSKDIFDPVVQKQCFQSVNYTQADQLDPKLLKMKDQLSEDLIPYEIEITKSKEAGRGAIKYMLFSSKNLRLYDNINQYLNDLPELISNSKALQTDLDILTDILDTPDIFE